MIFRVTDDIERALRRAGFWRGGVPTSSIVTDDWEALVAASDRLQPDTYAPDAGRCRSLNRFRWNNTSARLEEAGNNAPYCQSSTYNPELGDMQRRYPVSAVLSASNSVLVEIADVFAPALCRIASSPALLINVHHVRYWCRPGRPARNSPSGLHKDGERFISVHLISRRDLKGGMNRIADNERRCIAEFTLEHPGDCFLIDDTQVFHGVDEMQVSRGAPQGTRDILLVDYIPVDV